MKKWTVFTLLFVMAMFVSFVSYVYVYRADGSVERLGEEETLAAPEWLPEFRCAVADLFKPPSPL